MVGFGGTTMDTVMFGFGSWDVSAWYRADTALHVSSEMFSMI